MSSITDYCNRVADIVARKRPNSPRVTEHRAKLYMMLGYTENAAAKRILSQPEPNP